jgi:hypothetical protein
MRRCSQVAMLRCDPGSKGRKKSKVTYLPVSEYSTNTRASNYNLEENPNFSRKQKDAREQRNLLQQLESQEILPRRKRRVYDKPKNDYDISE